MNRSPRRPPRQVRRFLGAAAVALGCAGGLVGLGPAPRAVAEPIQSCSSSAGVLVAVNFGHWGGPVELGCAPASSTGYGAMTAAGFITAGTQSDGPAFICRIGLAGQGTSSFEPTPSEDPCVNTPPLSASWSYWHADAGQNSWSYSQGGAMSYRPPAGSVDAWTFGATNPSGSTGQPPFSPDEVRSAALSGGSAPFVATSPAPPTTAATAPPPSRTTVPTSTPKASGGDPPATSATAAASGSGTSLPHPGPSTTIPGTAAPSTAPERASTTTAAGGRAAQGPTGEAGSHRGASNGNVQMVASEAGSGTRRGSSGPPAGSVAGLAVVAVLAAAAGGVAWRRRRAG